MIERTPFQPAWVSPPGDTIADILEERGHTQTELAERAGFTKKHISALVRGKASITAETALRLEASLGSTARFWMSREAQYREALAWKERVEALAREKGWLELFPIAEMVRLGWIRKFTHKGEQVAECLRYFGVASTDSWRQHHEMLLAAFRKSDKFEAKRGAVAAWLWRGETIARGIECAPYDPRAFSERLKGFRALTLEADPARFVPALQEACAECGVAVVLEPGPKGCPASGATRWLAPEKAMLLLSLRYKSNDQLWFTFFHEAMHILKHSKKGVFLEEVEVQNQELEDEANWLAGNLLIPEAYMERLRRQPPRSKAAVQKIAQDLGIAPGIVVGRLQKEGLLDHSYMNALKVWYRWTEREEER